MSVLIWIFDASPSTVMPPTPFGPPPALNGAICTTALSFCTDMKLVGRDLGVLLPVDQLVGLQHEIEVFERLKGVRVVDRVDLRLDEFFGLALFTLCLSAFASVFAFLLLFGIDAFDRGLLRLGRHAREQHDYR